MTRGRLLLLVGLASALVSAPAAGAPSGSFTFIGKVTRIVDGDTVTVRLTSGKSERVRLLGIDSPERGVCFSSEATARTRALAYGKRVSLIGDRTQDTRDRYGRLLAYVQVARVDVGRQLVAGGYARVYVFKRPFLRVAGYRAAESQAKAKSSGLWACGAEPEEPSEPPPPPPAKAACADGIDNDGDGRIDYPLDPGCSSSTDTDENTPSVQCDDGLDNDGDGLVDYPRDSDCTGPTDTTEAAAPAPARCDPSYPTVCIPPPPPDLDCGDIPYRDFAVIGSDPHRFDGDRDGRGCEG